MSKTRESIKKRMEHSYNTKDRGGSRPQAFDWSKVEDIKFYTPKEKKNKICIISYPIKTKNDPLVYSKDSDIGDDSYMLDIQQHTYIGPVKADIACLKQFGKKCPICDKAAEFYANKDKESASALWPSRFCYYNVIDMLNPDDGIQVFGIKYNKFEKVLITAARAASDDDGIMDFSDNANSMIISFWGENVTKNINGKNATYLEFSNFTFKPTEKFDKAIIKQALSFDEYMKLLSTDEVAKILEGDVEDNADSDDEDEKPNAKGKAKKPVVEDDEEDEDVDDDDDTDDEEDTDESEDNDEDDDEDEDEDKEDDKPIPRAKVKPVTKKVIIGKKVNTIMKCPAKHKFGIDTDKFPDDCSDCDIWADCAKEQKKLKAKNKEVF
jgi:hypothetical protein